jgi:rod shape-determining protein MreC
MPRFPRESKNALILAGLLFAQLVLVSFQVPLGDRPSLFEKAAFALFAPLQRGVRAVVRGTSGLWGRYVYLRNVEAQNRRLRDEVFHLRQENTLLRSGLDRLRDREAAADYLRSLGRAFVLASVVGVDAANPYKAVTIDAGAAQGIRKDMPVLDIRGRLVGRVVSPVGRHEATVQLVTDDASAVSVSTRVSRVMGVLSGDGASGRCWLKYIWASNDTVAESETLLTSGFDGIYPPGLGVGTIISIQTDSSLFKRIAVAPFLDFRELALVAVLVGTGRAGE